MSTQTTDELVKAAWQVLDDMSRGECCCALAKAKLRIAIEPFIVGNDDLNLDYNLIDAKTVERLCQ